MASCGHSFCRSCFLSVLDAQDGSGCHNCPECREDYPDRTPLEKKRRLNNIVERFLSTPPYMDDSRIFCTYCTKSPVAAVKSCLQCENSLCDEHLMAHNQTMDHTLTEPTGSFGSKKCSIHKKVLEYYCPQDAACLCVSCCLVGKHRGHQVELLDEASEKIMMKLRKYLEELNPQKAELHIRVQNLHDRKRNIREKASDKRKNIGKLFMDIKEQLEMAEKKALSEISRQEDELISQISHLLKELEMKENEMSRKMHHMEEMCHVTDPIRLLQESDITVFSRGHDGKIHSESERDAGLVSGQADVHRFDTNMQYNGTDPLTVLQELDQRAACSNGTMAAEKEAPVRDLHEIADDLDEIADDLDEVLISLTLHRSMRDIVSNVTNVTSELGFHVPDLLLDVETASEYVELSDDLKTATDLDKKQDRLESPGRFLSYPQVLSRCGLSSGRQYWEVAWNQVGRCDIGMSYASIEKEGDGSGTGDNDKSWCVTLEDSGYSVSHNSVIERLDSKPKCATLRVFLDYEAGRLSFYELCDPITHLYTFNISFTEPLYVIFYVEDGAAVTILTP